jgi:hypothetical protein
MWVVIFGSAIVYWAFDMNDSNPVVGYTEHDLPVTKQDLENMEKENVE